MPTALPPIPQDQYDQHREDDFRARSGQQLAALADTRLRQEQQAEAARQDFLARSAQQLDAVRQQQADDQAGRAFLDRSGAQIAALRNGAPRPQGPAPPAPAMPGGADSGGAVGAQFAPPGDPLQRVYQDARAAGLDDEGARVAAAIARTEQGFTGDVGDLDQNPLGSAGTFQLNFGGGMGNAYARARGISDQQAQAELRADPHSANAYALGGYLGRAIRAGQAQGLHGADLATYAQRVGQRSVSPERSGASYTALQGQSFDQGAAGTPAGAEAVSRSTEALFVAPDADAYTGERGAIRARAQSYVGTPYLWGGADKQGIDCSAFISRAWGTARQTTDTLSSVADPIPKEELTPGDALNLTTAQDPRGYGHVRMFDGWADANRTQMYVYESSTATGGVARRVIPYDAAYTPMRLRGLGAADPTAYQVAMHQRAPPVVAEQAEPSRPTTVPIQPEEEPTAADPFARRVPVVERTPTVADVGGSGTEIETPNRWHRVGEAIRDALGGAPWNQPGAPTPAEVGAAESRGLGVADRPPSEFEPPSTYAYDPRDLIARRPVDPAIGRTASALLGGTPAAGLVPPQTVTAGMQRGADVLLDQAQEARRTWRTFQEASALYAA